MAKERLNKWSEVLLKIAKADEKKVKWWWWWWCEDEYIFNEAWTHKFKKYAITFAHGNFLLNISGKIYNNVVAHFAFSSIFSASIFIHYVYILCIAQILNSVVETRQEMYNICKFSLTCNNLRNSLDKRVLTFIKLYFTAGDVEFAQYLMKIY